MYYQGATIADTVVIVALEPEYQLSPEAIASLSLENIPVLATGVGYGVYMAVSSNIRSLRVYLLLSFSLYKSLLLESRTTQDPALPIEVPSDEPNGDSNAESCGPLTSTQRVTASSGFTEVSPDAFGGEAKHFTEICVHIVLEGVDKSVIIHSRRPSNFHGSFVFRVGHDYIQQVLTAIIEHFEESCILQATRPFVLSCLGILATNMVLKIPMMVVEVVTWSIMTYYIIGFDSDTGRFFKHVFLLICIHQMSSGLFRFISSLGRNINVAKTFGSFGLLTIFFLGGFILARDDIKGWWIWCYWFSPMMYGQNGLAVNEFLGDSWKKITPNLSDTVGMTSLKSCGIFTKTYWYWIAIAASIGYMFLFNIFFTQALEFLNPFGSPQAVLSKDSVATRKAMKT
ncbi:pleiotropic drug resistance protein 1-like protein [Tanacetum coccineum]|uniref:Pleiotropic drug resistance protein 1-like protein n=1 Tax=Tanacetum coccineum TaxID=301880 RepID=A0ABQ5E7R4_9ASTR